MRNIVFNKGKTGAKYFPSTSELDEKGQADSLQAAQIMFKKFSDPVSTKESVNSNQNMLLKHHEQPIYHNQSRKNEHNLTRKLRPNDTSSISSRKINHNLNLSTQKSHGKANLHIDVPTPPSNNLNYNTSQDLENRLMEQGFSAKPVDIAVVAANLANTHMDSASLDSEESSTAHFELSQGLCRHRNGYHDTTCINEDSLGHPSVVNDKLHGRSQLIRNSTSPDNNVSAALSQSKIKNSQTVHTNELLKKNKSDTSIAYLRGVVSPKPNDGTSFKSTEIGTKTHSSNDLVATPFHITAFSNKDIVTQKSTDSLGQHSQNAITTDVYSDSDDYSLDNKTMGDKFSSNTQSSTVIFQNQAHTTTINRPHRPGNVSPSKLVTYQGTLPDLIPNYSRNTTLGKIKSKLLRSTASKTILPIKSSISGKENGKTIIKTEQNLTFRTTMRHTDENNDKSMGSAFYLEKDVDDYDSGTDADDSDSDVDDYTFNDSKNKLVKTEDLVRNKVKTELGHNFYSSTDTISRNKFDEDRPWRSHQDLFYITPEERKRYEGMWVSNRYLYLSLLPWYSKMMKGEEVHVHPLPDEGLMLNLVVKNIWMRSNLPVDLLTKIYNLVDTRKDCTLDRSSFIVGMWLVDQSLYGRKLPVRIPLTVWNSTDKYNLHPISLAAAKNISKQKKRLIKKEMKQIKKEIKGAAHA